ncbi:molecular chaperone [Shewanella pneumatophori]|uniref:Pili assembly chaperone N-terminal domain-containing protein n=1 Tax=Shewanella pneumatophori TaxID=314092 RepID=A0A9X1ZCX5_9GAMM|nr:hypothetical protein [Shewanella pneumatophori]MCL1137467.1 hypothetical protein [Shewanella pneumatophori]
MKKILLCCIASLLAFNASANLLVNPTRVELDRKNTSAVFSLVNKSKSSARYNIYFEDKKMLSNGEYVELSKQEVTHSLASFVRYSPRRVNIEPEQGVRVRLAARLPRNIVQGEYRSYIVFHQIPLAPKSSTDATEQSTDTFSLSISAYMKVAIPVVMRVGDLTSELTIEKSAVNSTKQTIEVTLRRTGERSSIGDIEVINPQTKQIVGANKNVAIYTEVNQRQFSIPLNQPVAAGTKLLIRYQENDSLFQAKTVEANLII